MPTITRRFSAALEMNAAVLPSSVAFVSAVDEDEPGRDADIAPRRPAPRANNLGAAFCMHTYTHMDLCTGSPSRGVRLKTNEPEQPKQLPTNSLEGKCHWAHVAWGNRRLPWCGH